MHKLHNQSVSINYIEYNICCTIPLTMQFWKAVNYIYNEFWPWMCHKVKSEACIKLCVCGGGGGGGG